MTAAANHREVCAATVPRFAVSESQQLVLGLLLFCVVPLGWLIAAAASAGGRAGLLDRLGAVHRFAAWGMGWLLTPALVAGLLVLGWGVVDQSRAINLTLTGALAGVVGALLYELITFAAYTAGLFPYHPLLLLGRLVGGFDVAPPTVRTLGWLTLALLGAAVGAGYGTMIGNYDWWWGGVAALVMFLVGGLAPALALAGGGPFQLGRGPLPLLTHLLASAAFGLLVGAAVASWATTRGLLIATLFAGELMAFLLSGLREPTPDVGELLVLFASAGDAELTFRQTELLDLLASAGPATAARWLRELLDASAQLPGNQQQRLADGRARALSLMPGRQRATLVDLYTRVLAELPDYHRDRELRLTRRALRLLPRERQQEIEARLTRG